MPYTWKTVGYHIITLIKRAEKDVKLQFKKVEKFLPDFYSLVGYRCWVRSMFNCPIGHWFVIFSLELNDDHSCSAGLMYYIALAISPTMVGDCTNNLWLQSSWCPVCCAFNSLCLFCSALSFYLNQAYFNLRLMYPRYIHYFHSLLPKNRNCDAFFG